MTKTSLEKILQCFRFQEIMTKIETHICYIANIVLGTVISVLCHLIPISSMK